jgi:uncharacterized membrane protein YqjE
LVHLLVPEVQVEAVPVTAETSLVEPEQQIKASMVDLVKTQLRIMVAEVAEEREL